MKRQELIQRLEEKMTLKNYALDTVKSYRAVCNNFFSWLVENPECKKLEPSKRIESFLTHRVMDDDISPSTQNVEFNALIYLHREILEIDVHDINSLRARPKVRIPPHPQQGTGPATDLRSANPIPVDCKTIVRHRVACK